MKNISIIIFSLIILLFSSCEDVLDKKDLTKVDDAIWDRYSSAKLYINNLYAENMPAFSMSSNRGITDEGYVSGEETLAFAYGIYQEADINVENTFSIATFRKIRAINLAIQGIKNGKITEEEKSLLMGQALFFRAWRYWELVKLYGGVPIVLTAQDPFFDDLDLPRSSTKASIEAIVSDLNKAIEYLPNKWELNEDKGRIVSGAAVAFKGRVLLAWASPMFNPQNKNERWVDAYNANLEAKSILDENGFGLYPEFDKIFTSTPEDNPEAVMYRAYKANTDDFKNGWEFTIRPPSGGGDMGAAPTWNLVKAFPMANGKMISDQDSGYDSTFFWNGRDPRFYATIGYNGSRWEMSGRALDVLWTFAQYRGEGQRTPATGFYTRKASDPSVAIENTKNTSTTWIEIRYAEVLMNLAECANETGKSEEAIGLIGQIRERAGIEAANNYGLGSGLSKEVLRELIMNERFIEFAYENKRYWDLRRRKMFTEDLGPNTPKLNGTKRYGLIIDAAGSWKSVIRGGEYRGWRRIDTAVVMGHVDIERPGDATKYFAGTLKEMDATLAAFGRENESAVLNYLDPYYFFPLSQQVIRRSKAIEQTKGWLYGTFDPLAE